MKARYNKYKDTDVEKAAEYLLSEPEDTPATHPCSIIRTM